MEFNLCLGTYRAIFVLSSISLAYAEYCIEYGHSCKEPHRCCDQACCIPSELEEHYRNHLRWSVWNMWYFWFVVLFVLMSCFGGCSYYRRHQLLMARQQGMLGGSTEDQYPGWRFNPSFPVSLFSGYSARNQHQRVTHVERIRTSPPIATPTFPSPPAYSEVMSQPDMYPANKEIELPPYPGAGSQGFYTSLPSYTGPVVQLPPYTVAATSMEPGHHDNQATHPASNQSMETALPSNQSSNQEGNIATVDGIHGNSSSHTGEVPPGERTKYDCTTQTVSGIGS